MNQEHLQSPNPIEVILMLDSGALSTGIESLLFQKKEDLGIRRFTPDSYMDFRGEPGEQKKKVVVLEYTVGHADSAERLMSLLSNPDVMQILMVNTHDNMVQVLKKQQVMLTDKKDFAKIVQAGHAFKGFDLR